MYSHTSLTIPYLSGGGIWDRTKKCYELSLHSLLVHALKISTATVLCAAGLDRLLFLSALQQQQQQHHQTCWQECCQHLPQLLLQDMACCLACCREGNWDTCQHQLVLLLLQQRSGNCSKRSGWQQELLFRPQPHLE